MRAIAFVLALLLSVCANAQAPAVSSTVPAPPASTASTPAASGNVDWEKPDRSCKVDDDCQVKNVGNCCGVHRECVNKDAPTDPAKVKAMCGQEHRMGMCNTRAIGGCSCSQGQCQELNPASMHKFP